jgi:hypothetical protein
MSTPTQLLLTLESFFFFVVHQTVINCIRTIYHFTSAYPSVLSGSNASILLPYLKNPTTVRNLQLFTAFDVLTFPCIGRRASDVRLPIKNLQSLYSFPAENCGQVWARIAAGSSTYDHQTLDGWRLTCK